MSYRSPTSRPAYTIATLASLAFLLSGCGLFGTKQIAQTEQELDAAALVAQDVPNVDATENHLTQRALGRDMATPNSDIPAIPFRYLAASSSSDNLVRPAESAADLPQPGSAPAASANPSDAPAPTQPPLLVSQPEASVAPAQPPLLVSRPDIPARDDTAPAQLAPIVNAPARPTQPAPIAADQLNNVTSNGLPVLPVAQHVPSVDDVSTADFRNVVLESKTPVIVDFYADWCGPCKKLAPQLHQIAQQRPDIRVVKVNIDDHKALARQYQVRSIPTVILFRNGKLVAQHTGLPQIQQAAGLR